VKKALDEAGQLYHGQFKSINEKIAELEAAGKAVDPLLKETREKLNKAIEDVGAERRVHQAAGHDPAPREDGPPPARASATSRRKPRRSTSSAARSRPRRAPRSVRSASTTTPRTPRRSIATSASARRR
jgi:hypothetical protein